MILLTKPNSNSYLIILDLDETILDQRTYSMPTPEYMSIDSNFWKEWNAQDLVISMNQWQRRRLSRAGNTNMDIRSMRDRLSRLRQSYADIVIFRPAFMKFIAYTQTHRAATFDIMLYSMAVSDLLIYHTVTMEMYYNAVYAARKKLPGFEFKYVIARTENKRYSTMQKPKSLDMLLRIIGDDVNIVKEYDNIVILDDMGRRVWSNVIPQEICERGMNVIGIQAPAFECYNGDEVVFDKHEMNHVTHIRKDDHTFIYFLADLKNLAQNQGGADLCWFDLSYYHRHLLAIDLP